MIFEGLFYTYLADYLHILAITTGAVSRILLCFSLHIEDYYSFLGFNHDIKKNLINTENDVTNILLLDPTMSAVFRFCFRLEKQQSGSWWLPGLFCPLSGGSLCSEGWMSSRLCLYHGMMCIGLAYST